MGVELAGVCSRHQDPCLGLQQWDCCSVSCLELQSLTPFLTDSFTAWAVLPFLSSRLGRGGAGLWEGRAGNAFAVLWAVATVEFLLPGAALVQAASSSQVFAQHILLCSCTSAALVTWPRNTSPVWEQPWETRAGLRSRRGQCAGGWLCVLWVDLAWKCQLDSPGFPGYLWKNLHLQIGNILNDALEKWNSKTLFVISLGWPACV